MILNRTFFALVFAGALMFTAIWGQFGLSIDPDGAKTTAAAPAAPGDGSTSGFGLSIDPDGSH